MITKERAAIVLSAPRDVGVVQYMLVATGGAFGVAPRERRGAPRKAPRGAATRRGPLKPLWEHLKSATVPRRPDVTGPFFLRRLRVIAKSVPCKLTAGTSGRRASAARFLIFGGAWRRVSAAAAARWRRLAERWRRVGRGVAERRQSWRTCRHRAATRRQCTTAAAPTRREAQLTCRDAAPRGAAATRWRPVAARSRRVAARSRRVGGAWQRSAPPPRHLDRKT